MKLDIAPVDATFGAVVRGIRLNALDDATWRALYDAWLEYALLIFPGQHLTRDEQRAFAKRFGPLEYDMLKTGNVKDDGTLYTAENDEGMVNLLKGTTNWHQDSTYTPVQAKGAVFCADLLPEGGTQTGFADMRAAYDALDAATRAKVESLSAYHSFNEKQNRLGKQVLSGKEALDKIGGKGAGAFVVNDQRRLRPLVKVHSETGRKCLTIGHHLVGIDGMEQDAADAFLDALVAAACQPPRTYYYDWTSGDAVVWDNRCLLHRAVPWDMTLPRIMWHSRIAGDPVAEAALVQAA
jgi:alpha-ketoglutarate-dependent taurine dioxygenase